MKKILFLIVAITLLAFCLIGCDIILPSKPEDDGTVPTSDGVFDYRLNDDKQSYTVIDLKGDKAEDVEIPATFNKLPVTAIAVDAFHLNSITGIKIPYSIESIGLSAFSICKNLSDITVDEKNPVYKSVDGILYSKDGKTLVRYPMNKSLVEFVIPEGVTEIGNESFFSSDRLQSVVISKGVKKISSSAFSSSKHLSSVTFLSGEVEIDILAFSNTGLTSIELPEGITQINSYMFSRCEKLTDVKLPESLTTISTAAFSGCKSLTDIVIPRAVQKIENDAFSNTALTDIFIPENATEVSFGAFCLCETLCNINIDEKNSVYKSVDGIVYSKDGKTLVFYPNGKPEEEFVIPEGVTKVGNTSFYYAKNLKSVVISEGVTEIGSGAFSNCSSLINVSLSDSVKIIRSRAFNSCVFLEKLVIGNGVTDIETEAFKSCWRLKQVIIGDKVERISTRAFLQASNLVSVVIPKSVTSIGTNAFGACPSMEKIFFAGNAEEWEKMPVSPDCGDGLVSVAVYFFSENQPEAEGNFWHYNDLGEPIAW